MSRLPSHFPVLIPLVLEDCEQLLEDASHRVVAFDRKADTHVSLVQHDLIDNYIIYLIDHASKPLSASHAMLADCVGAVRKIESIQDQAKKSEVDLDDATTTEQESPDLIRDLSKLIKIKEQLNDIISRMSNVMLKHVTCIYKISASLIEKKDNKDEEESR